MRSRFLQRSVSKMTRTATIRRRHSAQTMIRRPMTHRMVCIAAAAAFSTSATTHAWLTATEMGSRAPHLHHNRASSSPISPAMPRISVLPMPAEHSTRSATTTKTKTTRLYSSGMQRRFNNNNKNGDDDDENDSKLFGLARKVLPTKWFGTKKEKEARERKKMVRSRVRGELDEMLKGAPLPIKMFGKYVAAPMMGKIASTVAEAGREQQETMEAILDEARLLLTNDPDVSSLLGTPIQIGMPFSQMSSTTVINGRRQMRTELAVEISGPIRNGVSRIVATDEGIGQLLVESSGKVFNIDLSSRGRMSPPPYRNGGGGGDDDTIIEAEIVDKDTKY